MPSDNQDLSLKPLCMQLHLKGYTPATLLMDVKTGSPEEEVKAIQPEVNYDGKYRGPVQVRFARQIL